MSGPTTSAPLESGGAESTIAWVGPFAIFVGWMAIDGALPIANPAREILRDAVLVLSIALLSRGILPRSAPHWPASIALGLAIFGLWIAPDLIVAGWRDHAVFQNGVTGRLTTTPPAGALTPLMLALRTARAALIVPVVEELFWRGWLPRWLQDTRFARVPLGGYTTMAFVATAVLFGAEHGPFWEVGLASGVIFNWWMYRTRSIGDLVLTHAVTNLALSLFVIATGRWSFWL